MRRIPQVGYGRLVIAAFVAVLVAGLAARPALAGPELVFDLESGAVYDATDALDSWHPASVTKIMTAYVTFRALREGRVKLTTPVVMSKNAAGEPPSKMGFKPGTVLTIDNALKMMLVKSANDVAVALGEAVSGSEGDFVAEMNAVSQLIGMSRTHWANPNGLPNDAQVTTARDLGILTRAVLNDFPEYRGYFAISAIQHGKRVLRSHNKLIDRYPGTIGMKTGFICASGFNMVAASKRGGRTVIAVVLGARSGLERAAIAKKLLDEGFESRSLFAAKRQTLDQLTGSMAGPVDMRPIICGKNRQRPGLDELVEDDDSNGFQMATAYASNDVLRALHKSKSGPDLSDKAKGKKQDPLTVLIGPPIYAKQPVQVFTGGADANNPVTARAASEQLPGIESDAPVETAGNPNMRSDVPLPPRKP